MTTLVTAAGGSAQPVARRRSYGRYVGARCWVRSGSLLFVLVVNFFLFRVLPGDPARTLGRGRFRSEASSTRSGRSTAWTSRCSSSSSRS